MIIQVMPPVSCTACAMISAGFPAQYFPGFVVVDISDHFQVSAEYCDRAEDFGRFRGSSGFRVH